MTTTRTRMLHLQRRYLNSPRCHLRRARVLRGFWREEDIEELESPARGRDALEALRDGYCFNA